MQPPHQATKSDTSQAPPQCQVHAQTAVGPCPRCGTFLCARCRVLENLCESCVRHLGGPERLTVEALALGSGSSLLVRRGVAMGIDLFPSAGLMLAMYRLTGATGLDLPQWTGWFWFLGYYLVCEALWGASLGKWLLSIRVVDERGQAPGWSRAARRTLTRFFEANGLLCGGLPALLIASRSRARQRLGDQWAGTYVLRIEDLRRLTEHSATAGPTRSA
jgi:uncharacterized RDD family membrane protein YckC